ncbi:hypothetical protein [Sphingobacterium paludis]|uniref:DUF4369 domain-containing protein n=1 Tax=Sphingobacterium paludis TaxID=1476465 RepID=A0A4R7DES3_9SPHI|nr:hypothetical protein [Sphingobacterium paludis]TDS17686.1 hypothetical protein B0I21_101557 [Sphingobacterium paludis]
MINKSLPVLSILLLLGNFVFAQVSDSRCDCPENKFAPTQPEAFFHLSSGESIALCGYRADDDARDLFSEFVVTVCGSDTILDFWDASLLCEVRQIGDTLFIGQIASLPIGMEYAREDIAWLIEKITLAEGTLDRKLQLNTDVRRYSRSEIDTVLRQYEQADSVPNEYNMALVARLFIATISGDTMARSYFMRVRERFGIQDGAYSQEYRFLQHMLAHWDREEGVSSAGY